ncbi:ABC transporter permease subunit [Halorussus halophilus]|uniref:ABC transporter permease subunit n=1 Tax=Halorussus halophilus TaxID=2650975 RepID=UPI0013014192|nr:ABC transporter permease subunit [Halorussus halophilus]
MSWQAVARKDFQDSIRSKWLWALTVLFVGIFALPLFLLFYLEMGTAPSQGQSGTSDVFIYLMKQGTSILIPLISIVMAYAAITRERASGSLKLLLSLPHSREDVVFGKVLGRGAVLTVPIIIGFVVAAFLLLFTSLSFKFVNFLLFGILTVLLGVVFVGLSVGISAAAESNELAIIPSIGLFFWFVVLWNSFANQVVNALTKYAGLGTEGKYQALLFIKLMNPTQAYKTLVDTVLMESAFQSRLLMFGLFNRQKAAQVLGESLPVFLSNAFVVIYLLFWLFVPVAVGYWAFDQADL